MKMLITNLNYYGVEFTKDNVYDTLNSLIDDRYTLVEDNYVVIKG